MVDGEIMNHVYRFAYDHKKEALFVQPTGTVLYAAREEGRLRSIPELKIVLAPAELLHEGLVQAARESENGDTKVTAERITGWFNHLIQQAQDAHSAFFN